jgi:two-component system, chemotaxis family, protein-glutamate methylesterase/glutaminase
VTVAGRQINVMVVDDSAVVREVVQQVLNKQPDIKVIGTAQDPIYALQRMQAQWPDVILLDIEMPRMDGITFLRQIMRDRPTPTVICSSLAEKGMQTTFDALAAGAVSIVTKPHIGVRDFLRENENELAQAIRAAAASNVRRILATPAAAPKLTADAVLAAPGPTSLARTTDRFIAIGISTGGTQALEYVLSALPRTSPGLVIVQHMPELFTRGFAARLDGLCEIEVKEASTGDRVLAGQALIAPGGKHLLIKRSGAQYLAEVVEGPLVSRHRPSVDVLFRSVAKAAGRNAMGMIMTGMGDDGARGLKEMFDVGSQTVAQDEASCVVFGMPKEAIKHGGVREVLGLATFAQTIVNYGR